jgi:Zn-dependent peptidase ImmA (M78 family)
LEDENQKLKLAAKELAKRIFAEFRTDDVFEIAKKNSVEIFYEKWFPVTIGEFDRKNKTISVNLNASVAVEKIIAHELGHFFAQSLNLNKTEEEIFCDDFAKALLEN